MKRILLQSVFLVILIFLTSCSLGGQSSNNVELTPGPYEIQEPLIGDPYTVPNIQTERVNNCDGRNPKYIITRSLSSENSTSLDIGSEARALIGIEVPASLKAEIEAKINDAVKRNVGEKLGQEKELTLETESGVIRDYIITWNDSKVKGFIEIKYPAGLAKINFDRTIGIELYDRTSTAYICDNIYTEPTAIIPTAPESETIPALPPEPTSFPSIYTNRWIQEQDKVPERGTILSWQLSPGQILYLSGGQLRFNDQYCGGDSKQICVFLFSATTDQTISVDGLIPRNNYFGISPSLTLQEALSEKEPQLWHSPNCIDGCRRATVLFFTDGKLTDTQTIIAP